MLGLFDTHAHIDASAFEADRDEMMARASLAGVSHIVCIGASDEMKANYTSLALAAKHPCVYATVGVHPHDARVVDAACLEEIERLSFGPKVVAIGETGLDYHYDHSPREKQREVFRSFLQLAKRRSLPVVIHTREAEEDTIQIMREERAQDIGGVMHCFSGTRGLAEAALELDFYLSFSGILTFKTAEEIREVAKACPKDRALVETDCPYLAPLPFRGKRNEPAFVKHTAEKLAELWGLSLEETARITHENARRFFRLPLEGGGTA